MEKVDTIALSLTDMVFEHRNKSYGAYQLRNIYDKYLQKATVIGVTAFCLILAFLWKTFAYSPIDNQIIDVNATLSTVDTPPPIEEPFTPPPPPAVKPPTATAAWIEMVVAPEEEATPQEELTKNEDLLDKAISTINQDGEPPSGDNLYLEVGTNTVVGDLLDKPETEIFTRVEQMPEFPGGDAGLVKFLSNNLRFPASAQQKGISGVVYVGFVINNKGEVTDIKVLKGIDQDCDEEALRVIGKMPKWKPGRQNGGTVSVRYTLPLRFSISQQ
jgi:protein TonB